MRRKRDLIADHPGTISHGSGDKCTTCDKRQREKKPGQTPTIQRNTATLQAYLSWRAPFRAKAGTQ